MIYFISLLLLAFCTDNALSDRHLESSNIAGRKGQSRYEYLLPFSSCASRITVMRNIFFSSASANSLKITKYLTKTS